MSMSFTPPATAGGAGYNPQMFAYGAGPAQSQSQWNQGGSPMMGGQIIKGTFLPAGRRRLNFVPILMCIFLPWLLFCFTYWVGAFTVHYENPSMYFFLVGVGFSSVLAVGLLAVRKKVKWFSTAEESPSWLVFLAISMFLCWAAGYVLGGANYNANMQRYYDMNNLNNYTNVYPNRMRGQQLMDAGSITFTEGTRLDISKSMGFKNKQIYCVAPISYGATPPGTYDFWAVGTDCCNGNQANFHCAGFSNPRANGGLRLMLDGERAFYRLAVQQAEATYNIKAVHPLFFHWVQQPVEIVNSWKYKGENDFLMGVSTAFVFQTFIVGFATLVFSKLGHA